MAVAASTCGATGASASPHVAESVTAATASTWRRSRGGITWVSFASARVDASATALSSPALPARPAPCAPWAASWRPTVIATASRPHGGETTVIALDRALAAAGRFPSLDPAGTWTTRAEALVGEEGIEEITRARA